MRTLTNVEILESDFVTVEWTSMVGRRPGPSHDLRPTQPETVDIVGNLPYYVTSDIVLRILDEHQSIGRAVIMVQREVADRISAEPGSRDYGLLSATAQLFARVENLLHPSSRRLQSRAQGTFQRAATDHGAAYGGVAGRSAPFVGMLKLAFAQTQDAGKQPEGPLHRAGHTLVPSCSGVRTDIRAEALSLDNMAALFRALQQA